MDKLAARPAVKFIFQTAFNFKVHIHKYFGLKVPGLDLIFGTFRKEIGGRLRLMLSGGAPIAADTQTFLRMCFSVNAVQGYGLTESCGVITLQMTGMCCL
jgi:long-chain acyl-CoA synthetase